MKRNLATLTIILILTLGLTSCGNGGGSSAPGGNNNSITYTISGTIVTNGIALSGVLVTLSGNGSISATTDSNGFYSFSGVQNGTYNITPSKTGYTFSPTSHTVSVNGANATGQNFTALTTTGTTCESKIPSEQPSSVRHEVTFFPSPPNNYGSVLGWVNATIGTGGTTGKVTVSNLKLWENLNGVKTVIAEKITCPTCTNPDDQVWGFSLDKSQWQIPSAWAKSNEGTKFLVSGPAVIVPVSSRPTDVYHFWHALWPRPTGKNTATYFVTADVFVEGDAMVQIGIDFWQTTNSGTNIEAAVSNWACSSAAVQTVKAGAYQ